MTVGLVVCVLAILQAMLVVMAAEFVRMRAEAHLETAEERPSSRRPRTGTTTRSTSPPR